MAGSARERLETEARKRSPEELDKVPEVRRGR